MKALFNGQCDNCKRFKPRCADMIERIQNEDNVSIRPLVVCEDCRKSPENKGKFMLTEKHK